MKIVIGAHPDDSGHDSLALGSVLCRALHAEPILANIRPAAFSFPGPGAVDAEWDRYLLEESLSVLAKARQEMADDFDWPDVRTIVGAHRSSGQGLADVAAAENADLVVIGSAPGGHGGAFVIGSTADKLLHGSPVPVACAPAGYRRERPEAIGEIVVGFRNTAESLQALAKGAEYAEVARVPLLALTLVIVGRMHGSRLGSSGERGLSDALAEQAREAQEAALLGVELANGVRSMTAVADSPNAALQRLQWAGDEILVLGSARGGPLQRVFLGDMTYRVLRSTPVPAIVLPRHAD